MTREWTDAVVIGAGPAGSVAAALLAGLGYRVVVVERARFPRFVIGESLLPQCMESLARADLLAAVESRGYQRKNGALFCQDERRAIVDFGVQFTSGYASTYQVPRGDFDLTLADAAAARGADLRFGHTVRQVEVDRELPRLEVEADGGGVHRIETRFIFDASGYGRVLPRVLGLDKPSTLPPMAACFAHVRDDRRGPGVDPEKIVIAVHPDDRRVWYWLIPFAGGLASVGVVARPDFLAAYPDDAELRLRRLVSEEPYLAARLGTLDLVLPPRAITGYSTSVTRLHGPGYALLGNAGEFLDPVFSSGVTLAMKSAELAVDAFHAQQQKGNNDWQTAFAEPLLSGGDVFASFVRRWYDGSLQSILFCEKKTPAIYARICSVLAGYVWDRTNPFCREPDRHLAALAEFCR